MKKMIRRPDDFHVHFRSGQMLKNVVRWTSTRFGRALVMPNTNPPILTCQEAISYRDSIRELTENDGFEPLMTLYLTETTKTEELARAQREAGVIAGKLYLKGVTHNSEHGVSNLQQMKACFSAMQDLGLVLCIHGEDPEAYCMEAEQKFLPKLETIANAFPRLRIVMEHITTAAAVEAVKMLPSQVGATITPHHLYATTDALLKGKLRPHHYCLPIPKGPDDLDALSRAASSGSAKFFLGTDSAPHLREDKESAAGCAGVFNAPCALPLLAEVFDEDSTLSKLEYFTSVAGAEFYGLPLSRDLISLAEEADYYFKSRIPDEIHGIVPYLAKRSMKWRVLRTFN